ncbi:MauE/DoxX family redox-associated membrane protein [Flavobacterium sp. 5]|uniref:MauE/DoxX family redox-associated membrane protein n=1 Tax=Flavobacterium sp. 5 TaxID=2035199 RepID=UPI000C2CBCDE|nr:MauE/DoxX family redox-associated membrane protein [Flavobacterium sp. 5]PKB18056.1 methylamine utilization protein MauE [Flavobacterium sp. 5]
MKLSTIFVKNYQTLISYLFILLFVYAAVSKILDFQNFQAQLGQSPLLSPFADYAAVGVLTLELVIAVLLAVPIFRYYTLHAAVSLMVLFTTYIIIILNFSSFVPCSCGGILEKLGWKEHLIFNTSFVVLGIIAIILHSITKQVLFRLVTLLFISSTFIVGLFLFSEDIMQKENPFIRSFPQGTASKVAGIDLLNTSYYVAGTGKGKIYLANRLAPLQILEIDTNLKSKKLSTILLDRENFKFQAVEVRVSYPDFYLYDGTVPVIYKGKVADWKAKVISDKQFYFSDIQFINTNLIAFRTQKQYSGENILATISHNDTLQIKYNQRVLQKQMDGIFDTDGTFQYSPEQKKLVYTYYYRNEYIVTDENLNVQHRAHTIDTTSKAKLKVVKIKQSGDSKLAAPPYMVNRHTTITNNLLFVNSVLRGRYEDAAVWKNATVVDVYDITKQTYVLSFYVFDEEGFKMKNFFATRDALYVISGHFLLKYGYGERIRSKLGKFEL